MRLGGLVLAGATTLASAAAIGAEDEPVMMRVVGVYDGDTLLVERGSVRKLIRLHGVDAPEWEQRWGHTSGNRVAQLCLWEWVEVTAVMQDWYDRDVSLVRLPDGRLLQTVLLEEGLAWVYRRYMWGAAEDEWLMIERDARIQHEGLWHDDDPTPPWTWRNWRW